MEKTKRWKIYLVICVCMILFAGKIIKMQKIMTEFVDSYYETMISGFLPIVSKREQTFSGTILSDMIKIYYREAVPLLKYRTDYKGKNGENLVQDDYYFWEDEATDEIVQEVKKEQKPFHTKKWENPRYLRKYIYQIDSTTTVTDRELNGKVLLSKNLKLKRMGKPQILIYHTHGSEAYRGSKS